MKKLSVKLAKNINEINTCYKIRTKVFVDEQNVPPEIEYDEQDKISIHFLLLENDIPIGTGRFFDENNIAIIGRICILKEHRGKNAGLFLMQGILNYCKEQNFSKAILGAQEYALGFYNKLGFEVCSEKYMDANIPHFKMQLNLDKHNLIKLK